MFKVLLLTAILHPKAFIKGFYGGIKSYNQKRKDPNYIPPSPEVRKHTQEELTKKLKTLI
jgi:truncated hemoglobin YjbI